MTEGQTRRATGVALRGCEARARTRVHARDTRVGAGSTGIAHGNTRVHRRRRTSVDTATREELVDAAVAVVVERVADLGLGTDRSGTGTEGARRAGLRTTHADAEARRAARERVAGLGQGSASEDIIVDQAIAVVVDGVAGLSDGHERSRRGNALDGSSTDALDGASRHAASRSDGASTTGGRAAAAGRAREIAAVAVLIDRVTADLESRTDFTRAGAPEGSFGEADTGLRSGNADTATRERHRVTRAGLDDAFVDQSVAVVVDAIAGLTHGVTSGDVAGHHAGRTHVRTVTATGADTLETRRRRGNDAGVGTTDDAGVGDAVAVFVVEVATDLEGRENFSRTGAEGACRADACSSLAKTDAGGTGATRVAALDVAVDATIAVVVQVVADFGCRRTSDRGADELHTGAAVCTHAHAGTDAGAAGCAHASVTTTGHGEKKTAVAVLVHHVVGDLGRGTDRTGTCRPRHHRGIVVLRTVHADADTRVARGEGKAGTADVVVDGAVAVVVEAVRRDALGAASGFVGHSRADLVVHGIAHPRAGDRADAEASATGNRSDDVGVGATGCAHAAVAHGASIVGRARVRDALAPHVASVAVLEARTERTVRGRTVGIQRTDRVADAGARGVTRDGRRNGCRAVDLPAVARDVTHEVTGLVGADGHAIGTLTCDAGATLGLRTHGSGIDERLDTASRDGRARTHEEARGQSDERDEMDQKRRRTMHGRTLFLS